MSEEDAIVFDGWVNLPYAKGEVEPDPSIGRWFKEGHEHYDGGQSLSDVVEVMDRYDIAGGVLTKVVRDITPAFVGGLRMDTEILHKTCTQVAEGVEAYPDRFIGSIGLDPRLGYEAAKHLRIAAEQYGIKVFRICPLFSNIPINDALAYPLYTAACDLGVAITANVGMPGPMKPMRNQQTWQIDDVALCFPELKIVMTHVGDPWVDTTVALLNKHPNVYLMSAGWAPKYLPEEVRTYMGSRGPRKVMWASDYPVLGIERTIAEGRALDVRPRALPGYLGLNALRVFGAPSNWKHELPED